MSEIALNDFSTGEIIALESNKVMAGDEDVEMGEDGVLLEAPSPILWTKDLELENGFVEVRGFS